MPAPERCPGCGTKLQPDWESCPNCPLSFGDGPTQKTALQSDTFRGTVLPIVFFACLAFAVWAMAQMFWTAAESGTQAAANSIKPGGGSIAVPKTPGTPGAPGVPAPDAHSVQAIIDGKNPIADEGPGVVSVMPESKPKPVKEWKMRGTVYDLITLKPVAGARLILTDNETNAKAEIVTDSAGRYKTILPPLPGHGYIVAIAKAGYEKAYLNPETDGVAQMPLARRQELRRELSTLIEAPSTLMPAGEAPLITDFHIAPK